MVPGHLPGHFSALQGSFRSLRPPRLDIFVGTKQFLLTLWSIPDGTLHLGPSRAPQHTSLFQVVHKILKQGTKFKKFTKFEKGIQNFKYYKQITKFQKSNKILKQGTKFQKIHKFSKQGTKFQKFYKIFKQGTKFHKITKVLQISKQVTKISQTFTKTQKNQEL